MLSLWCQPQQTPDGLRDQLLQDVGPQILALEGVHAARLTVADSAVADAAARRLVMHEPAPDAVLSLWVDFAGHAARWSPLLNNCVARFSTYLVAEGEPLSSQASHPAPVGERVQGMCQVVWIRKPAEQDYGQWLSIWKDSHTPLAIEIQSNFGYRQNVVVRAIGEEAMPFDAIVEENFPAAAMASDHAFYATDDDDALLQQRIGEMTSSCARFIDFSHIDVVPMSEYVIRPLVAA